MLVLSRKTQQTIVITAGSERITVVIVEQRGETVRVGIDAPRSIAINRGEIQVRVDAESSDAPESPVLQMEGSVQ